MTHSVVSALPKKIPPEFEAIVRCPQCNEIYSWANVPITLPCGHDMCDSCLRNTFYSSQDREVCLIEVLCFRCPEGGNRITNYSNYREDYERFVQAYFTINYGLLAQAYRCLPKGVFVAEANGTTIAPTELMIEYKDDSSFDSDVSEEVSAEEVKKGFTEKKPAGRGAVLPSGVDVPALVGKNSKLSHSEYRCRYCQRLFNKRNVPIIMKCKHEVCEYCVISKGTNMADGKLTFRCPCKAGTIPLKVNIPKNYSLHWVLRKVANIDKELLARIYDKISIDAKRAAWEFSLRKRPRDKELEARMCCHSCKNTFIETAPYHLACGHNTCIACAYDSLRKFKRVLCSIDSSETTIKCPERVKSPADLQLRLKENSVLKEYTKANYADADEEYSPREGCEQATAESQTECPVCMVEYNSKDRKPYFMCKSDHLICEQCLKKIIERKVAQKTNDEVGIECVKCREITNCVAKDAKAIAEYLELFRKR